MIFLSRLSSLRTATKYQRTTIETVIASEEGEIDSDRIGQSFKKIQISKVY